MLYDDTIAAIATPPGEGGIGIVRLSGSEALPLLERIFVPFRRGGWRPFQMRYGRVIETTGELDYARAGNEGALSKGHVDETGSSLDARKC